MLEVGFNLPLKVKTLLILSFTVLFYLLILCHERLKRVGHSPGVFSFLLNVLLCLELNNKEKSFAVSRD